MKVTLFGVALVSATMMFDKTMAVPLKQYDSSIFAETDGEFNFGGLVDKAKGLFGMGGDDEPAEAAPAPAAAAPAGTSNTILKSIENRDKVS